MNDRMPQPGEHILTWQGEAVVTACFIADRDPGDEDPSERQSWHLNANVVGQIHRAEIRGVLSV